MSIETAPDPRPGNARAPKPQGNDAGRGFTPGSFPLTVAQASIVLDALAMPNSPVANIGHIAQIHGYIDCKIFAAACRQVVAETPWLRLSFSHHQDEVVQEFIDLDNYTLEQHDFSTEPQPELASEAWIEEHFWAPLPWNSFPLFRLALIKLRNDHFVFVQKYHHGIIDATGRSQCLARIADVYESLLQGRQPKPAEIVPLASRLVEESDYLASEACQADTAYWKKRFHSFPDPLIDADRSKSERARSGRPQRIYYDIGPEEFAHLKKAAATLSGSVPRMALALTYVALSRLYGLNDIVVGFPFHNRTTEASKQSIDLQMTVMPYRMTFGAEMTLAEMLKKIAALLVADRRHGRFPFVSLVRMAARRELGSSLFDIILNYIPATGTVSLGEARVANNHFSDGFYTPLAVGIRETHDGTAAKLTIAFDPGLVERSDGERLAKCLHFLLTNPIDFSRQTIGTVPIIDDQERHHLLVELNNTDMPLPAGATLASLCQRQAERTPDAIAVTCGTISITYAQLHAKAENLAGHLRAAGLGPEIIAAVALPRDIELIIALLAIHKAGGAYLPLDLALPGERIAYMIADAQAQLVVTTRREAAHLPPTSAAPIYLEDLHSAPDAPTGFGAAKPENLAYVIYTSGSTGQPKGVAIEHRNAVNLVLFHADRIAPGDLGGILFSSSLSFDASIDEIFVSLVSGGRLIIVETPLSLPSAPARDAVRVVEAAPSVFEALLQVGEFDLNDRLVRFGGEPLSRALVDRLFAVAPRVRIENSYGPTETTVDATIATLRRDDKNEPSIGKALWNTKLYVLDRNRELLPKGAKGELYIGGAGVARGYLNQPELTAERFVNNPYGEGRLYRTGDVVRWREDGELDFFRRTDDQVKINGLRIELGEIERQLETMPEIAQAIAIIHSDGRGAKRIFAFAAARDDKHLPDTLAINKHLREKLPKYMMPAALTWVEKFPLTASGKLDRNALPLPAWGSSEKTYRAPSNRDEASLAQIWSEVLGIAKIGMDDDFFELGGTSLQAVTIFAKISRVHSFDLPAATMVRAPTIAEQAAVLQEIWRANDRSLLVTFRENGEGPPLFFVHGGGGGVMYVSDLMQDLRCLNPIYGLHAPPLDGGARLPRRIEEFSTRYIREIRKVQPVGPYNIIGYSGGGTIAYEMARQLRQSGDMVAFLGLIETTTTRYRGSAVPIPAEAPSIITGSDAPLFRTVKRAYGNARKAITKIKYESPNKIRHALGIAIPHAERDGFFMRWFAKAETIYEPQPYPGPVTLFARKETAGLYQSLWAKLIGHALIIRELPVDRHLGIVALPTSRFLAAQIDASLKALATDDQGAPGL